MVNQIKRAMRELLIEEKAKAYDEVREKIAIRFGSNIADEIFSQFEMSEDEKIRKALIHYFTTSYNIAFIGDKKITNKDVIAWLEKQSEPPADNQFTLEQASILDKHIDKFLEQKSVDEVEPKFKVGEWITNGEFTWYIKKVGNGFYDLKSSDGRVVDDTISHVDEQFHSFTIEDIKDGDVLVASDGSIFLFAGVVDCACKYYVALTTDGVININEGLIHYWETSKSVHPATKEQRDLLFQKLKEAGYAFDFEKKELKKIEQNHAENSCKNSDDITTEEKDRTEYKKGFECGKQRVLKYPEDFGLCKTLTA